jgi:polyphosphate kinase 2 (PPK2 family)
VSKKEQKRRFLARTEDPERNWKFSASDMAERQYWHEYQDAYEDMIRNTATKDSPWCVVPADNKWFTRAVVGAAIVGTLASLDLAYPKVDKKRREEIASARTLLQSNNGAAKKAAA